jgi:hypothetical protein
MAVGLVIDVWRNEPVEDMHYAKCGPSDAGMFAESRSLHSQAVKAQAAEDRPTGLLEFEDHLLDRGRPWAGTGGTDRPDLGGSDPMARSPALRRSQESQGDSHRHSPASVSDRSVLTLRLSRRLVLPVWTETCTEISTNAAADAGGHPRLSKTPRSGLNRDRTHRGQKMAPLQRKSMASLSARSKE